jgi:hypothetical protein
MLDAFPVTASMAMPQKLAIIRSKAKGIRITTGRTVALPVGTATALEPQRLSYCSGGGLGGILAMLIVTDTTRPTCSNRGAVFI